MYDSIFAFGIKENQMIWSIIVMLDNQKDKIIHMHFVKNLYIFMKPVLETCIMHTTCIHGIFKNF